MSGEERFELDPDDAGYPALVQEGYETPPHIYGIGDPEALQGPCISIIGARRATPYGLEVAHMAGRVSAEAGICIVSGGALGCDVQASRGALEAGGRTVIVSGCGADRVYPRSSDDIFAAARKGAGCVISLERWGEGPKRYTFPKRNVLIAALSPVLIVCEAGRKSGTMGTAEAAMEMGRSVYAVPGSIFSPTSQGTNYLIQNGCGLIADELGLEQVLSSDYGCERRLTRSGMPAWGRVLSALVASPMRPQDLAGKIGLDELTVADTLSSYEEMGLVTKLPDGCFAPSEKAYRLMEAEPDG